MATSILLVLRQGIRRWPPPFFLFFFRRCGDGHPLPSLRKKKQRDEFKKKKQERGMAISILTILPSGDGEMITSLHSLRRKKDIN